jgi:hypothetical protein
MWTSPEIYYLWKLGPVMKYAPELYLKYLFLKIDAMHRLPFAALDTLQYVNSLWNDEIDNILYFSVRWQSFGTARRCESEVKRHESHIPRRKNVMRNTTSAWVDSIWTKGLKTSGGSRVWRGAKLTLACFFEAKNGLQWRRQGDSSR